MNAEVARHSVARGLADKPPVEPPSEHERARFQIFRDDRDHPSGAPPRSAKLLRVSDRRQKAVGKADHRLDLIRVGQASAAVRLRRYLCRAASRSRSACRAPRRIQPSARADSSACRCRPRRPRHCQLAACSRYICCSGGTPYPLARAVQLFRVDVAERPDNRSVRCFELGQMPPRDPTAADKSDSHIHFAMSS